MNPSPVRPNWFYPVLVWICSVTTGSLLFALYTAFFVKNDSHGVTGVFTLLFYILFGALLLSLISLGVSYLAFTTSIPTRMKKSTARLLTILPHVLLILYFGMSFLRSEQENAIITGSMYILLYIAPLLVFASLFDPQKKEK